MMNNHVSPLNTGSFFWLIGGSAGRSGLAAAYLEIPRHAGDTVVLPATDKTSTSHGSRSANVLVTFTTQYQVEFFWVGIAFNFAGIAFIGSRLWKATKENAQCVHA